MRALESGDRRGEWRQMGSVDPSSRQWVLSTAPVPKRSFDLSFPFCFTSSRWVLRKSQHYVGKSGKSRNSSNKGCPTTEIVWYRTGDTLDQTEAFHKFLAWLLGYLPGADYTEAADLTVETGWWRQLKLHNGNDLA